MAQNEGPICYSELKKVQWSFYFMFLFCLWYYRRVNWCPPNIPSPFFLASWVLILFWYLRLTFLTQVNPNYSKSIVPTHSHLPKHPHQVWFREGAWDIILTNEEWWEACNAGFWKKIFLLLKRHTKWSTLFFCCILPLSYWNIWNYDNHLIS